MQNNRESDSISNHKIYMNLLKFQCCIILSLERLHSTSCNFVTQYININYKFDINFMYVEDYKILLNILLLSFNLAA